MPSERQLLCRVHTEQMKRVHGRGEVCYTGMGEILWMQEGVQHFLNLCSEG